MRLLVLHPQAWTRIDNPGVDVRHVSIGGERPRRLDKDITYDGIGEVAVQSGIDELHNIASTFKPDIFLFGIHFGLTPDIVQQVKDLSGCKCVMHYTDQRIGVPNDVLQYREQLDLLLLTNQDWADHAKYNEIGIDTRVFYDGVDTSEYYPLSIDVSYDCFFGGNNFAGLVNELKSRSAVIPPGILFPGNEFREKFLNGVNSNFDLQVRGKYGWSDFGLRRPLKRMAYHPHYNAVLQSAKINLNAYNIKLRKLYTRRLFRALAVGRLYVTQYVDGMEDDFTDGENIVWFRSIDEGLDKIKYYLVNKSKREKIAVNSVHLINARHTVAHRLNEFIGICQEIV